MDFLTRSLPSLAFSAPELPLLRPAIISSSSDFLIPRDSSCPQVSHHLTQLTGFSFHASPSAKNSAMGVYAALTRVWRCCRCADHNMWHRRTCYNCAAAGAAHVRCTRCRVLMLDQAQIRNLEVLWS